MFINARNASAIALCVFVLSAIHVPVRAQGVFPLPETSPDLRFEVAGSVNAVVPLKLSEAGPQLYLIGGDFDRVGGEVRRNVALLDALGNLADIGADTDWVQGTNGPVHAIAVHDGTVIIGGDFSEAGGVPRTRLARFDLQTRSVDSSYTPAPNGPVFALAADGLGNVYVGGAFSSITAGGTTVNRERSAKLDTAGAVVAGWNPGYVSANVVYALHYDTNGSAVPADHRLYVGGSLRAGGGSGQQRAVARLFATTGVRDDGWAAGVRSQGGASVRSITTDGGFVYLGGTLRGVGGSQNRRNIARVSKADGSLDGWNPDADGAVRALRIAADGHVLVGGEFLNIGGASRKHIAKISSGTDAAVPGFIANGDRVAVSLAVDTAGRVLVGGSFSQINGEARNGIARVDVSSGVVDALFIGANAGGPGDVNAFAFDSAGGIIIGGSFDTVRFANSQISVPRANLMRLAPDFSIDEAWRADAVGDVLSVAIHEDRLYVGGRFSQIAGAARARLAQFVLGANALPTLQPWNVAADGEVRKIAADAGGVWVSGDFTLLGAEARNDVGRITAAGAVTAWNPNPNDLVRAIASDGVHVYLGGDFGMAGGGSHAGVARVDAINGVADAGFDFDIDVLGGESVHALTLDGSSLYVGGSFASIGGANVSRLARIDVAPAVPGLDAGFTPWGDSLGEIRTIATDANGHLYVGGLFAGAAGLARANLARIGVLGTVDLGWRPGTDRDVGQLAVLANGHVLAAGAFWTVSGQSRIGLAQLSANISDTVLASVVSITPAGAAAGTASVVGQPYTVAWSLANQTRPGILPPGTVTVSASTGESCVAVAAAFSGSCQLTATSSGARTITVAYASTSVEFLDAMATAVHQVNAAQLAMTVSTAPNSSSLGASVTATITLALQAPGAGTPTGSVQVRVDGSAANGCVITLPALSCDLGFLANAGFGSFAIDAIYTDAELPANFTATPATAQHAVGTATSVSLSAPATATVLSTAQVSVLTSNIPDGAEVIVTGASGCTITINDNAGSCDITFGSIGSIQMNASFAGTAALVPSQHSVSVAVSRIVSSLSMALNPASPAVGAAVTVSITTNLPSGSEVVIGNAPGCASITLPTTSCQTSFAAAGPVTVTAAFTETDQRSAANASVQATVNDPAATEVDLGVQMRVLNSRFFVVAGVEMVEFSIVASNAGPGNVVAATLAATVDADAFDIINWTCAPADRCSATSGNTDPVGVMLTLAGGQSAEVRIMSERKPSALEGALAMASIEAPADRNDPVAANNEATVVYQRCHANIVRGATPEVPELIEHTCVYRDGFEQP
jgi:hypothetical protein